MIHRLQFNRNENKRFVRKRANEVVQATKEEYRKCLDDIAKRLQFNSIDDWYNMTTRKVRANGGGKVLQQYNTSLVSALTDLYSEKEWDIFRFNNVPQKFWQNRDNQLAFLERIRKHFKITKEEDWYSLNSVDIKRQGGGAIIKHYGNLYSTLRSLYPTFDWKIWRFKDVTKSFWRSEANQRLFLDDFAEKNNFQSMEEWYSLKTIQLREFGGSTLLSLYNGSLSKLLFSVYPHYQWDLMKFDQLPLHYWSSLTNQQHFMEKLYVKFEYRCFSDWHSLTLKQIRENRGASLLEKYNSSLYRLFLSLYPNYPWDVRSFKKLPKNWWDKPADLRNYFDQISPSLGVQKLEDWYFISPKQFKEEGGWAASSILTHYSNLYLALMVAYPQLDIFQFAKYPKRFFESKQNQILFLQHFAKLNNITKPSDWSRFTSNDINLAGGSTLLLKYNCNLFECLSQLFPTVFHNQIQNNSLSVINVNNNNNNNNKYHNMMLNEYNNKFELKISRFSARSKRKFWSDPEKVRKLLSSIICNFNIKKKEDWNRISIFQIRKSIGEPLLLCSKSPRTLPGLLNFFYPGEFSLSSRSLSTKRSTQFHLYNQLQRIFPHLQIIEEYKPHHLFFPNSGAPIELDFFIPNLNIGVEYQGQQHYEELHNFGPSSLYQERDKQKLEICNENSLHLLIVPYWWDQSLISLQYSLRQLPIF